MPLGQEIERFSRIDQIPQQFVARNTRQSVGPALSDPLFQAHVGKFGENCQPAVDDVKPFERNEKWMADALYAVQRLQLLRGKLILIAAVNNFDGFLDAAGRLGPPHLGVAARTDPIGQCVAWNRDFTDLGAGRHEMRLISCPRCAVAVAAAAPTQSGVTPRGWSLRLSQGRARGRSLFPGTAKYYAGVRRAAAPA